MQWLQVSTTWSHGLVHQFLHHYLRLSMSLLTSLTFKALILTLCDQRLFPGSGVSHKRLDNHRYQHQNKDDQT